MSTLPTVVRLYALWGELMSTRARPSGGRGDEWLLPREAGILELISDILPALRA
jgi:hypothetical protein